VFGAISSGVCCSAGGKTSALPGDHRGDSLRATVETTELPRPRDDASGESNVCLFLFRTQAWLPALLQKVVQPFQCRIHRPH